MAVHKRHVDDGLAQSNGNISTRIRGSTYIEKPSIKED